MLSIIVLLYCEQHVVVMSLHIRPHAVCALCFCAFVRCLPINHQCAASPVAVVPAAGASAAPAADIPGLSDWVWNEDDIGEGGLVEDDDKVFKHGGNGGTTAVRGSVGFTSGKYQWEVTLVTNSGTHCTCGVCTDGTHCLCRLLCLL